jgi:anti-sigma B factor antagonist
LTGANEGDARSEGADFRVERTDGVAVLRVLGELDLTGAAAYDRARAEALGAGLPLVIDLRECEFIDSLGLAGLIHAFNRATEAGKGFALAAPGEQTRRVLHASGMEEFLPCFRTLEDALGHVRG